MIGSKLIQLYLFMLQCRELSIFKIILSLIRFFSHDSGKGRYMRYDDIIPKLQKEFWRRSSLFDSNTVLKCALFTKKMSIYKFQRNLYHNMVWDACQNNSIGFRLFIYANCRRINYITHWKNPSLNKIFGDFSNKRFLVWISLRRFFVNFHLFYLINKPF